MTNLLAKYEDCGSKGSQVIGGTSYWTDKLIPVYPPYNFVVLGYKKLPYDNFSTANIYDISGPTSEAYYFKGHYSKQGQG
jgi:hypothetical protein